MRGENTSEKSAGPGRGGLLRGSKYCKEGSGGCGSCTEPKEVEQ